MPISLLLQLFFITILSPALIGKTIVTNDNRKCLEHEKTLLLELKHQLVFDSSYSTKLVQWNQRDDCCSWKGVECDSAGHVMSLQPNDEAISGGLNDSSSVFSLEYLEKLNLAGNELNGAEIPRGIHKLTYLTHLNMSGVDFGGEIPIEISELRRLVSLDISQNWQIQLNLKMLLQNLTQLRQVYLDGIDLSTQGNEWFHVMSSSLRELSLQRCGLSGPLDLHSLLHLHFLSVLRLDGNNLSTLVPDLFANFSSLTTLSLSSCSLKGYFPEMIFQLPSLQNLDLSGNPLLRGTIPQFPRTSSLRSMDLHETNFSGSLPDSICNLKNLSVIILSGCQFSGLIPSTLGNLTELVYVDFSYNFFTGSISSSHFDALSNLVYMSLTYNSLTGTIPSSIFALPSLLEISLRNNNFSGQVNEFSIVNISILEYLDLSSNRLEGPFPNSFFQLRSLRYIWLSNNLFNNTFQLEILSLPNLTYLDLSDNKLSLLDATATPHFVRQSTLDYLDLSNNQIAGEIPNWIWEIGNITLGYLNLSCNMLVGLQKPYNMPASLSLDILDLHSNQLRGELPLLPLQHAAYVDYSNNYFDNSNILNIGNFFVFNLLFLSLANNRLSGSFPPFICNSTYLRVLDLSGNNLSGSIPPCLFENLERLKVLNLGRNNISGRIPNKISPNCSLKTFDLSNNNLVGDVPLSLAYCNSLAVMNVGSNHIDDVFPCMLPSSLQVLVLQSNRFHGEVGCNKSWPNLQIMDIASNNLGGYLNPFNFSGWRGMVRDSEAKLTRSNLGVQTSVYGEFDSYYRDEVMLTIKGLELKLVKIWPEFTSIDFSCNNFHGDIPETICDLKSLYLLNLSHNSLAGAILNSFGKLRQLGSLDLSVNQLTGEIPKDLAGLTFLQIMNVSHNKLVGKIPVGSQIHTFSPDSFEGNTGLCGLPLSISCTNTDASPPKLGNVQSHGKAEIEWDYVFAALGYVVGLGSIVWVLLCCRSFREKYFEKIEDVFEKISYRRQHGRRRHGARRVLRNQNITRQ